MEAVLSAIWEVVNSKQQEKESVADYAQRLRTKYTIMKNNVNIKLTKYLNEQKGYNEKKSPVKAEEMSEAANEQLFAFVVLKNADPKRFGSLIKDMASQYSRGTQQYPKTSEEAQEILERHKPDNRF